MKIYRLMHSHASTEAVYGNELALGCYSDLREIEKAKDNYRSIIGFSQYPNGFCIFEHIVEGETDCNHEYVYVAEVYIRDETYDFERINCLGVFGNNVIAEQSLSSFQALNTHFINNSGLIIECTVSKCKLNEMDWKEGFNFN